MLLSKELLHPVERYVRATAAIGVVLSRCVGTADRIIASFTKLLVLRCLHEVEGIVRPRQRIVLTVLLLVPYYDTAVSSIRCTRVVILGLTGIILGPNYFALAVHRVLIAGTVTGISGAGPRRVPLVARTRLQLTVMVRTGCLCPLEVNQLIITLGYMVYWESTNRSGFNIFTCRVVFFVMLLDHHHEVVIGGGLACLFAARREIIHHHWVLLGLGSRSRLVKRDDHLLLHQIE